MALPGVKIIIGNGQLGRVAPVNDAVMGLIVSGVAVTDKIGLAEPKAIFALEDAVELGIDAAYDVTNTTDAYGQIKEFYDRAPNGTELWIMIVAKTATMESVCDKTNDLAKKLLTAANGRIKMWGIARTPDSGYEPTFVDGIDDDVDAAVLKAQELCEDFALQHKPCRFLVGARDFQGVVGDLKDFRQSSQNRGGVVLGSVRDSGEPAVGFTLGQFANRPVQRNIGRVKDGDLGLSEAYLTDGTSVDEYENAWGSIHDKGYIFFRTFPNKNGYYFNDDPSCSPLTDDYSSLARGRVIDKAHVIAYTTFVEELLDDLEIDEDGYMDAAVVKDYQQKIENAIGVLMVPAEASGVICEIDPRQNLLANDTVKVSALKVRPRGYAKYIEIPLGFANPFNS